MKKLIAFFLLITVVVGFRQFFTDSLKKYYMSDNDMDVGNKEDNSAQDTISEKFENVEDNLNQELKRFYEIESTICEKNFEKYENLVKTMDNYIQRYISLFLITSNLLDYKIKDPQEQVTVDLELSISGGDLIYLQKYSKMTQKSSNSRNLSKLDAIFSKIARLKERSYMEKAFRFYSSNSFFIGPIFSALNNPNFFNYLSFIVILLMTCLAYNYLFHKLTVCFGIIVNSMIIWDSFNLYWKRLKEMDTEIYVKTMHLKGSQEDCNPANYKWYHSISGYFWQDKCLQYYQNLNKNSMEEVSLFKCITDTYSYYLIQTPARILGGSLKDFYEEISDIWPWPFKYFVSIPLVPLFLIIFAFIILILCGKRLRLSFLGAAIELGDCNPFPRNEKTAVTTDSAPISCREIRKLKPWTKVRSHRRLDRDIGTRRKLLLKAYKSFSEVSHSVISNALESSVNFNATNETSNNPVKENESIIKHD